MRVHLLVAFKRYILIGASLSEPHTSESNSALVSIYIYLLWYVRLPNLNTKFKFCVLRITYAKRITRSTRTPLRLIIVYARADRMEATGSLQVQ